MQLIHGGLQQIRDAASGVPFCRNSGMAFTMRFVHSLCRSLVPTHIAKPHLRPPACGRFARRNSQTPGYPSPQDFPGDPWMAAARLTLGLMTPGRTVLRRPCTPRSQGKALHCQVLGATSSQDGLSRGGILLPAAHWGRVWACCLPSMKCMICQE